MKSELQESKKPKKENLKQRAYLNSVTSVLDYGSKTLTGFIITPFIVNGLGAVLYGAWQILGQFTSYTGLVDIRATQVLKWAIAKDREAKEGEELREYVTATFLLVLLIVPLLLVAGAVISWYAPVITQIDAEYFFIVRITCALLVLALVTKKVFSIFESILRGMNLGFKRMGFRAAIYVVGGGLKVLAIWLGYGLIGLAAVQIIVTIAIGVTVYVIVKRHIPWFGFGKADIKRSLTFLKISGWFMGWTGTKLLLLSSDKILLGYIAGPILVTQYVITKYLANTIQGIVSNIVHGVIPGIGKLYGNKEFGKLHKARRDIMLITWLLSITMASVIIIFNEPFLKLWIGEEHFAGQLANVLIIAMVVQYIFIQNDGAIINTTLEISHKVYFALAAAIISIALIITLVPYFDIIGLLIGIIIGRLVMTVGYPLVVNRKTNCNNVRLRPIFRLATTSVIVVFISIYISSVIPDVNWLGLILMVPISAMLLFMISFLIGIDKITRNEMLKYKNKISFFKSKE